MSKDSEITEPAIAFMREVGRPVTTSEIMEATGKSRQAVYQWVDRNAWRLHEAGVGRHNAKAYELNSEIDADARLPANFRPACTRGATSSPMVRGDVESLRVGMAVTVVAIRLDAGKLVCDLEGEGVAMTVQMT